MEKRIDELEIRVAHQEQALAELNELMIQQWKKMEALEQQIKRLGEELDGLGLNEAPASQKPPHY